jgi:hypothetical protein
VIEKAGHADAHPRTFTGRIAHLAGGGHAAFDPGPRFAADPDCPARTAAPWAPGLRPAGASCLHARWRKKSGSRPNPPES